MINLLSRVIRRPPPVHGGVELIIDASPYLSNTFAYRHLLGLRVRLASS